MEREQARSPSTLGLDIFVTASWQLSVRFWEMRMDLISFFLRVWIPLPKKIMSFSVYKFHFFPPKTAGWPHLGCGISHCLTKTLERSVVRILYNQNQFFLWINYQFFLPMVLRARLHGATQWNLYSVSYSATCSRHLLPRKWVQASWMQVSLHLTRLLSVLATWLTE